MVFDVIVFFLGNFFVLNDYLWYKYEFSLYYERVIMVCGLLLFVFDICFFDIGFFMFVYDVVCS